MEFDKDGIWSSEYYSVKGIDHLTYLQRAPSVFQNEYDLRMQQTDLVCAQCKNPVTRVSERVEVFGRHDHAFHLYGEMVPLGCFRNAPGCMGVQGISNGYSWFRGYSWQIQVCNSCYTQLGWKYISEKDSFYGLMFRMLREDRSDEEDKDQ